MHKSRKNLNFFLTIWFFLNFVRLCFWVICSIWSQYFVTNNAQTHNHLSRISPLSETRARNWPLFGLFLASLRQQQSVSMANHCLQWGFCLGCYILHVQSITLGESRADRSTLATGKTFMPLSGTMIKQLDRSVSLALLSILSNKARGGNYFCRRMTKH